MSTHLPDMQQKLIDYFTRIMPLSAEEIKGIVDSMQLETYKKGTILLKEGQVSTESYFVINGCVRQYYLVDGEEKITNFFTEEQWVISINSFTNKTPADHYFECCEDTTLVVGTEEKELDLYRRFPKFESISRQVMQTIFGEQQALMATYLTDTPEQRYRNIMNHRPHLLQRIPQYQIASYIGVKPESLSRIRKRIGNS